MKITTADLLDEYGAAMRDDWSQIDGRSEMRALRELSDAISARGFNPLDPVGVLTLRAELGLCLNGGGHWEYNCTGDCEAKS